MFEPYAMKVARTVLRGGKPVKAYLSQLDTQVVLAVNYECHRLDIVKYRGHLPFAICHLPFAICHFPLARWPFGGRPLKIYFLSLPVLNCTI